jgi:adenosine/AMP kinase
MIKMELELVKIEKPEDIQVILGTSHFIKTVEDLHEALVGSVPGIKFGLAFCEASGPCLIRWSGTDNEMIELAKKAAKDIGAGHSFIIFMKDTYPINVLRDIKNVHEVVTIHCASSNSLEVIIAQGAKGRGIVGVIDGESPKGIETLGDQKERKEFLRKIGYKS